MFSAKVARSGGDYRYLAARRNGCRELCFLTFFCNVSSLYGPDAFVVWALGFLIHKDRGYFSMPRPSADDVFSYDTLCFLSACYSQLESLKLDAFLQPILKLLFLGCARTNFYLVDHWSQTLSLGIYGRDPYPRFQFSRLSNNHILSVISNFDFGRHNGKPA